MPNTSRHRRSTWWDTWPHLYYAAASALSGGLDDEGNPKGEAEQW